MNPKSWRSWLGALALSVAAWGPAHAAVVTFDDAPTGLDSIFESGQTFGSGGFRFTPTSLNLPAIPGALVGAISDSGSMVIGPPPTNASGRFYAGYNDGGVKMSTGNDRALFIDSFDAGFIPFMSGFYELGATPGLMVVEYQDFLTGNIGYEFFDFSTADANGEFATGTFSGAGLGALYGRALTSATFFACLFDGNGGCINPTEFNEAWFALDNIDARVPEPPTLLLVASMLGLLVTRRRTIR